MDKIIEVFSSEADTFKQAQNKLDRWLENLKFQELAIRLDKLNEELSKYDVIDCRANKFYKIWSIRNDKTGFPHFLIYDKNQWKWQSAKYFRPIQEA